MRAALFISLLLCAINSHAQPFALVRSEIKTSGSSAGGQFQISGGLNTTSQKSAGNNFAIDGGFSPLGFTPPIPQLAHLFFTKSGTNLLIAWRSAAPGFYIESNPDLRRAAWSIVNPSRNIQTNLTIATIPIGTNQTTFRLRHASTLP
jgi:hypothetical protein